MILALPEQRVITNPQVSDDMLLSVSYAAVWLMRAEWEGEDRWLEQVRRTSHQLEAALQGLHRRVLYLQRFEPEKEDWKPRHKKDATFKLSPPPPA